MGGLFEISRADSMSGRKSARKLNSSDDLPAIYVAEETTAIFRPSATSEVLP